MLHGLVICLWTAVSFEKTSIAKLILFTPIAYDCSVFICKCLQRQIEVSFVRMNCNGNFTTPIIHFIVISITSGTGPESPFPLVLFVAAKGLFLSASSRFSSHPHVPCSLHRAFVQGSPLPDIAAIINRLLQLTQFGSWLPNNIEFNASNLDVRVLASFGEPNIAARVIIIVIQITG